MLLVQTQMLLLVQTQMLHSVLLCFSLHHKLGIKAIQCGRGTAMFLTALLDTARSRVYLFNPLHVAILAFLFLLILAVLY